MGNDKASCLRALGYPEWSSPSAEDIKKMWKQLCKRHHPDAGGKEEKFHEITHAYKYLTDASYRAQKRPDFRPTDLDLRVQFPITFEDAMFGTKVVLNYAVKEVGCDDVLQIETITVGVDVGSFNIPPTVVPAKGFKKGDVRGNLVVMIAVESHPKFKVQPSIGYNAYDIISQEVVGLDVLLKGGRMEFQTMYGFQDVRIRPGTSPGSQIRLKGKGCNGGDHIIVVAPNFPSEQELKSSKWKGLDIDWSD